MQNLSLEMPQYPIVAMDLYKVGLRTCFTEEEGVSPYHREGKGKGREKR
jgi:hypothetical protein